MLTEPEAQQLLDDLCEKLGFCFPDEERGRLLRKRSLSFEAFTDSVLAVEGLHGPRDLRRQVRGVIQAAFDRASENTLKWAVQALAAPAPAQWSLFPEFVNTADELALEFDRWYDVAVSKRRLDPVEQEALRALSDKLCAMSLGGSEHSQDLWTDTALEADPRWEQVRAMAADACARCGWPLELPPANPSDRGSVYVPGE